MRTLDSEKLHILLEAIKLVINSTRNISQEITSGSGSSTLSWITGNRYELDPFHTPV